MCNNNENRLEKHREYARSVELEGHAAQADVDDGAAERADHVGAAAEAALQEVEEAIDVGSRRSDARTPDLGEFI